MRLFDSHNHIQDDRLYSRIDSVIDRAGKAGVTAMGVKGCCESDWSRVAELAKRSSGLHPSFGLHPWFIASRSPSWREKLVAILEENPAAGVGEIGIDHAIEDRDDQDQETVFLQQLEVAQELDRPVSIHCRQAWGRLIELLDDAGPLPRGMLIHCYGGSAEVAGELVRRGAYISFSGSITRPNNRKAGPAIRSVPADRILIETDAPDILPHNVEEASILSVDGTLLNEPAHVRSVLSRAAELLAMPEEELAELTFRNAERFFGISR